MAGFTLAEVLHAVGGGTLIKGETTAFSAVVTDTRLIEPGALFVALQGERFDGHAFVRQAIDQGAGGAIVSAEDAAVDLSALAAVTIIRVPDTLKAYQALAGAHRRRFAIPVVAVTGSNGKTTTKDLTAAVLGARWNVLKTQANYNNEIGLPLTLFQLGAAHEAAIVEMGMRGRGQIAELAAIAQPTVGIVTNVGETHMELLGSLDNIAKAKSELVDAIAASGTVILNADNPYVRKMATQAKGKVLTFGYAADADVRAVDLARDGHSTNFHCVWRGAAQPLHLPLLGRHNVENALAAIAVGLEFGFSFREIQAGLDAFVATKMRLQFEKIGGYTVINDAYNASPASMAAAIDTLAEVGDGRKIAVLGDMLELGEAAVPAHTAVGEQLAARRIDAVITLGSLGASIAEAAERQGIESVFACHTHEEAGQALQRVLQAGDTVLFKGSRGMEMEKLITFIQG